MSTLITNIAELMTQDAEHRVLNDAAVVIEGERISWIGPAAGRTGSRRRRGRRRPGPAARAGWIRTRT